MPHYPLTLLNNQLQPVHPAQYLAAVKGVDVQANLKALWDMPYDADPILEPDFIGLTHGQVVMFRQIKLAAEGEGSSVDRVLNRMIGMPVQTTKNLNVRTTYQEYLDEIARKEGLIDAEGRVIREVSADPEIE